uniref:Protein kinase domain-containing protein n=1 Tax=Lates calcarifer TaxID=8187 RepID=A0A4W6FHM1_LATCA
MSTRKLEGEPAHYIDIAQAVHDLCLLRSDLTAIIFLSFRGTFGVVKRVVHRRTGEVFAAKFLPLRSSTRTRAFQERDLLSRLAHPRVACLLDFFCTRRTLVLITEMYPPC